MYNRYIPQQDGSYQRRTAPDKHQGAQKPQQRSQKQQQVQQNPQPSPPTEQVIPNLSQPATGFLRSLLPREFDTGDLIVVLLLLLMAGDCEQERNTALLTLALYFLL